MKLIIIFGIKIYQKMPRFLTGVRREEGWWPELELRRRVPPPRREAAGEGALPRAGEMGESRGGGTRGWEMGEGERIEEREGGK